MLASVSLNVSRDKRAAVRIGPGSGGHVIGVCASNGSDVRLVLSEAQLRALFLKLVDYELLEVGIEEAIRRAARKANRTLADVASGRALR